MKVILNKDVSGLGKEGSVHKVKDGYARNFLLPRGLALPLSDANLQKFDQMNKKRSEQLEKMRKQAEELKERLSNVSLTMPVLVHEENKLYGSISSLEIEQALKEEGFQIDKSLIKLDEPLKALGIYEVPVELHPEVEAKVKVWVVKK